MRIVVGGSEQNGFSPWSITACRSEAPIPFSDTMTPKLNIIMVILHTVHTIFRRRTPYPTFSCAKYLRTNMSRGDGSFHSVVKMHKTFNIQNLKKLKMNYL